MQPCAESRVVWDDGLILAFEARIMLHQEWRCLLNDPRPPIPASVPSVGFVELLGRKLPSTNKFYTLQEPLCAEAGLYMIHRLGKKAPRCFKSLGGFLGSVID